MQEQVAFDTRIERRRSRRFVASRSALCASLGLFEGSLATLTMLASALIYHLSIAHIPLRPASLELYIIYSFAVGLTYGAFSAAAAARFLDGTPQQHGVSGDSVLDWTAALAIALLGAFLADAAGDLSRVSLTSAYFVGIPLLLAARSTARRALSRRISTGQLQYRRAAVIGRHGDVVRFLLNGTLWRSGYQLAGTVYLEEISSDDGSPRESELVDFAQHSLARGADYIVFVGDLDKVDELERLTEVLKRFAVNVACVPATDNTSFKFLDVVPVGANNALRFLRRPMGDGAVLLKRSFDLLGAGVGLLLLSPFLAAVALIVKLDSPGPAFYRQERRGFNGKTFFIWKFRSMRVTESGRNMTQAHAGDSRITRVGRFIRAKSIDELPQLINVLKGEMSLVGPRPHALSHDDELGQQLARYAHRQRIKPGITGWAQINGYRGVTSTYQQIEGRTLHDLYYIDNWSIFLDCWIILLTVFSSKARLNAL